MIPTNFDSDSALNCAPPKPPKSQFTSGSIFALIKKSITDDPFYIDHKESTLCRHVGKGFNKCPNFKEGRCSFQHCYADLQSPPKHKLYKGKSMAPIEVQDQYCGQLTSRCYSIPAKYMYNTKLMNFTLHRRKDKTTRNNEIIGSLCYTWIFTKGKCSYWHNCTMVHVDLNYLETLTKQYECTYEQCPNRQGSQSTTCACPYAHKDALTVEQYKKQKIPQPPTDEEKKLLQRATDSVVSLSGNIVAASEETNSIVTAAVVVDLNNHTDFPPLLSPASPSPTTIARKMAVSNSKNIPTELTVAAFPCASRQVGVDIVYEDKVFRIAKRYLANTNFMKRQQFHYCSNPHCLMGTCDGVHLLQQAWDDGLVPAYVKAHDYIQLPEVAGEAAINH